jgi:hypothetical protein
MASMAAALPTRRESPRNRTLDSALLATGNDEIQLDLFLDYASNVSLYPQFSIFPYQAAALAGAPGAGTTRSSCRLVPGIQA